MKLFSHTERKGLVVLAPLLAVVILLVAVYEMYDGRLLSDDEVLQVVESSAVVELKAFNPNADSYEQLRQAGVPTEVAVGIVRWREYGKVYRMVEDLALVSGVTDSIYAALKPFVVIDEQLSIAGNAANRAGQRAGQKSYSNPEGNNLSKYESKPKQARESEPRTKYELKFRAKAEPFAIDTASAEYLSGWGMSLKQAEVLVKYRDASNGIFSEEHLRRCYVVDDEVADSLAKYIIYSTRKPSAGDGPKNGQNDGGNQGGIRSDKEYNHTPLEINSADSAALVAIDGIGPRSASEIIKYRKLLGGYYSVEQIRELKCIVEENFLKFLPKISCDSCKISKIDINFATPKELERHPYISAQALRRIIKQRQLKGGWTGIEEMTEQKILSEEQAKRLAPYLRFRPSATE